MLDKITSVSGTILSLVIVIAIARLIFRRGIGIRHIIIFFLAGPFVLQAVRSGAVWGWCYDFIKEVLKVLFL